MRRGSDTEHPDTIAALTVPALLSIATTAKLLDCSPRTVRRRIADGVLAAVSESGRTMVRADDLRAYVEGLASPRGASPPRRSRRSASPYAFADTKEPRLDRKP